MVFHFLSILLSKSVAIKEVFVFDLMRLVISLTQLSKRAPMIQCFELLKLLFGSNFVGTSDGEYTLCGV
jgi:hypothetical protein